MVGRSAAAVGLDHRDVGALGHVHLSVLGASPDRDRRRVLQEEHRVRDRTLRDRCGERALQVPGRLVFDQPEVQEIRATAHRDRGYPGGAWSGRGRREGGWRSRWRGSAARFCSRRHSARGCNQHTFRGRTTRTAYPTSSPIPLMHYSGSARDSSAPRHWSWSASRAAG